MIKTLWFVVKIILLIAGAIWLVSQPGDLAFNFMGYDIATQTGVFLIALVAFILVASFLLRMVRKVLSTPKAIVAYKAKYDYKVGYHALTRGLVAVAAGDAALATKYSQQTQKLLDEKGGLPLLLKAQAARLRGEEGVAKSSFEALLEDKDTSFLGIRGLMKSAIDEGDKEAALKHARTALKSHPHQKWILKLNYALECQNHNWEDVFSVGKKALKYDAITTEEYDSDRVAIYLMRHDYALEKNNQHEALRNLKQAEKLNPTFVPTILRYAKHYMAENKNKKAISFIERAWQKNPHPDLAQLWGELMPTPKKDAENFKLEWFEKLVTLNPDCIEGHIAAAKTAIDLQFWGDAKAHLMAAEKIYPTAKIFYLRALVEKNLTHNAESAEEVLKRASHSIPDKSWVCTETGMTYHAWTAIAVPHESFNTIVWDVPSAAIVKNDVLSSLRLDSTTLLLDPAA